jgi:hypothetical protein
MFADIKERVTFDPTKTEKQNGLQNTHISKFRKRKITPFKNAMWQTFMEKR